MLTNRCNFASLRKAPDTRRQTMCRTLNEPMSNTPVVWDNVNNQEIAVRFFPKVNKTKTCWLWTASTDESGYGRFRLFGNRDGSKLALQGAHRVSWFIRHGRIPVGMAVLHKCDVRLCVNPDHLFLGTQKENVQDMLLKGRNLTKLKPNDIQRIRLLGKMGLFQREIAKRFHVSRSNICSILSGKSWAHTQ